MTSDYSEKILVVEDNVQNQVLVSDLFAWKGYQMVVVSSGEDALSYLNNEIPDLILLDIQLPGMDGFEVFNKIRAKSSLDGVKIVALTALAMDHEKQKIEKMGFDAYILKPIEIAVFPGVISDLLKKDDG